MATLDEAMQSLMRGVVNLVTEEELRRRLQKSIKEKKPLRIKYGADPSTPDIHLGHTVPLRKLKQFQELGHTVVFIIGDFTATIGDPSGQTKTRPTLSYDEVKANARTYQDQVFKFLDPKQTEVHFNSEWFGKMKFSDIVQIASQYSVARMMERDDFSLRYKEGRPISVLEFLYPLIQGYDSVMIKSDVEIGGTDQTFNLLVGRDLQRSWGQEPQIVLTLPLLEGLDGRMKMSKSLGNTIGINESAKDVFGKLMSIPDLLIFKYFELLTDVDLSRLSSLQKSVSEATLNPMEVKKELAEKVVSDLSKSVEAGKKAREEFERIFSKRELPRDIEQFEFHSTRRDEKIWIVKLLQELGLVSSSSEARRSIKQAAVSIDEAKVLDENAQVVLTSGMIVKVGKLRLKKIFIKNT